MKALYCVPLAVLLSLSAMAGELEVKGMDFDQEFSRNTSAQGGAAMLSGMFGSGSAVYEFPVPEGVGRAGAEVRFDNLKGKWLKLYIYNYGTARDDDAVRNRRLDPQWRLWQATDGSGDWRTANPELMDLDSRDGRLDYLGPDRTVRLLLYAHPGVPYIGDARFLIKGVKLFYPEADQAGLQEVRDLLVTSEDAWVEGEFLLVRGRGLPPLSGDEKAGRIAATRAAKVVAFRNLAVALGRIPRTGGPTSAGGLRPAGGTAMVPPNRVRDSKINPDGSAEVVLEVRLGDIK